MPIGLYRCSKKKAFFKVFEKLSLALFSDKTPGLKLFSASIT